MKRKLLNFLLPAIFLCLAAATNAQSYSAKVYTGFEHTRSAAESWYFDSTQFLVLREVNANTLSLPTFAFSINSEKGFFHEVQLGGISNYKTNLNRVDERNYTYPIETEYKAFGITLAYEFNYRIFVNKTGKWSFFAGTNLQAYFLHSKNSMISPDPYTSTINEVNTSLGIVPRVQYKLGDKWFADLNFNYLLLSTENYRNQVIWHSANNAQQVNQYARSYTLPTSYRLRLGIGYNF